MRLLVTLYIRLKYLVLMDAPLWLHEHTYKIRARFMSKAERDRQLEVSGRRLLLGNLLSAEDKQLLAEVMQMLKDKTL